MERQIGAGAITMFPRTEMLDLIVIDGAARGIVTRDLIDGKIEAHLADANSHVKGTPDEIHCTLEARLTGMEPVVVKEQAGTAHQAIQGAVGKLRRAVSAALEKPRSRRSAGLPNVPEPDVTVDSSA